MDSFDYRITHIGDRATILFQTPRHGEMSMEFKFIDMPDGSKGLYYDSYNVALGQDMQTISDEEELAEDISLIINLLDKKDNPTYDISLIDTFDTIIEKHISQYGRLVDTDLCSNIAYIGLALKALSAKDPNGATFGPVHRGRLLEMLMGRAEQKFGDYLYLTKYSRTPFGIKPYLVSFNYLKKNL
jgi:hypothetical protein